MVDLWNAIIMGTPYRKLLIPLICHVELYMHLQDIALKEGVSRESLLRNKSSEHNVQNKRSYEKAPSLDELKSISVSLSQELEQVKTFNDSLIAMINDDEED